jgi:hypothetical protein
MRRRRARASGPRPRTPRTSGACANARGAADDASTTAISVVRCEATRRCFRAGPPRNDGDSSSSPSSVPGPTLGSRIRVEVGSRASTKPAPQRCTDGIRPLPSVAVHALVEDLRARSVRSCSEAEVLGHRRLTCGGRLRLTGAPGNLGRPGPSPACRPLRELSSAHG